MEFTKFVRKPFIIEAVEVTEDNIAEIASFIGVLHKKDDGTSFIRVHRLLFLNVGLVTPGFWMTKMGEQIRCYSKPVFNKQFVAITPDIETWFKELGTLTSDE